MSIFGSKAKAEEVHEALADLAVMMKPVRTVTVPMVAVIQPPPPPPAPFPDKPQALSAAPSMSAEDVEEYAGVADSVGMNVPELLIERFKLFMVKNDLPMYEVKTVVAYMDAVAKRDNPTGWGWEWKALRASDTKIAAVSFGTPSYSGDQWMRSDRPVEKRPASDYFITQHHQWINAGGGNLVQSHAQYAAPYARIVPLHALKRVAMIEREFGKDKIIFAVTDYTTDPHIRPNPDPFLMAVIPNPKLAEGVGRFVIDVWDEPGFGIVQMVK